MAFLQDLLSSNKIIINRICMNSEQPNPDPSETPPETPIETGRVITPLKRPFFLKRKVVFVPILLIALLLVASVIAYVVMRAQEKDTSETPSQSQITTDPKDTKPTVDSIYAYSDANLVAINPETKESVVVDTAIDGESYSAGLGSTTPLTAPNFRAAVYVKDNTGWVATGTEKRTFYSLPEAAKKTGFYTLYLSAWSSDSTKIAFAIEFMCPERGSTCTAADEDKNVPGIYVYDLVTEKASRVQAPSVMQWLPESSKLAYFDDSSDPGKLFLNDTTAGTIETVVTKKFGFGTQASISDDAKKILYTAGVNGTQSAATFISNIDGTDQKTLKTSSFADLQWPKFLPGSNSDYAYSKRKEIKCYEGTGGCVSASLHIVKGGADKKIVEDIDSKVIGFYKNQAIVVVSDGAVGLSPNNPAPYKAAVSLVDLNSSSVSKIYEKVTQKNGDVDMQISIRVSE
jgi:hypothetical protein